MDQSDIWSPKCTEALGEGAGGVTSLGLSPKNDQLLDSFPKTNLYLIELITKGDFNQGGIKCAKRRAGLIDSKVSH